MSMRLIEIIIDESDKDRVLGEIEKSDLEEELLLYWLKDAENGTLSARILTEVEESADLLDRLEKRFLADNDYRIVVYPVQATLPRLKEPEEKNGEDSTSEIKVSREELYASVMDDAEFSWRALVLALLSAVVAGLGLLNDNTAAIIGAMVIAPLLGPNVGLALATTLADSPLLRTSAKSLGAGLLAGLAVGAVIGLTCTVDPYAEEMALRTRVGLFDIVLALAAGSAGILSLSSGTAMTLVGVMVALALMPPLVATGLLLGAGHLHMALNAGLLTLANLICLNLSGMLVFLLRGVRPLRYREQKNAKAAIMKALVIWLTLLAGLGAAIYFQTPSN